MELVKINKSIPIKAIPEDKLDIILKTEFKYFVSNLLSINAENESKVDLALESLKTHCWSMGLKEIKKAFEMYADSKLNLKPLPNHLDRILVGKIITEYKTSKKQNEVVKTNEKEYKDLLDYKTCIEFFDMYAQDKKLQKESVWLYDYLTEYKKVIEYTAKEKVTVYNIELEKTKNKEQAKDNAKIKLVERYFDKLLAKEKHIKEYI